MTLPAIVPPSTLPRIRAQGHSITLGDVYAHDPKTTGHYRARRLKTSTTRTVTIDWFLTQAQMTALHNWFERTLLVGSRTFSIQVKTQGPGLSWWEAAWVAPYKAEPQTRGWWHVTGELRLLGTPSTIGPDLSVLAVEYDLPLTASASIDVQTSLAIEYGLELLSIASPNALEIEYALDLTTREPTICAVPAGAIALVLNTVSVTHTSSLSAELDAEFGSTRGSLLRRGVSAWELLLPSYEGEVLTMGADDPDWAPLGSDVGYGEVLANLAGSPIRGVSGTALTDLLDVVFGSTHGQILFRGASLWEVLNPGTDGNVLTTHSTSSDPTWSPVSSSISWKSSVRARTTADLGGYTYSNGASGVGATLTAPNNSAFGTLDGVTISVGDRVLIANESTASHNGIYTATVVSTGTTNTQFTRATDADTATELGDAIVVVESGTLYATRQFIQSAPASTITVGSTSLTWVSPPVLNYFTEALATASPNSTVNVSSFTASGGSTNQDFAAVPKGTGGLIGAIPDSTSTGGDARGRQSVDLQFSRSAAAQVVASDKSAIIAGNDNKIVGGGSPGNTGCAIIGGASNTINGTQSSNVAIIASDSCTTSTGSRFLVAGSSSYTGGTGGVTYGIASGYGINLASVYSCNYGAWFGRGHTVGASAVSDYSLVAGYNHTFNAQYTAVFGNTNTVPGSYNLVAGLNNTADGDCGFVWGQYATPRGMVGGNAFARTRRAATGDAQMRHAVLNVQTTNATTTALTSGGGAASNTNQFKLATGPSVIKLSGHVTAINRTSGDVSAWEISGVCKQISGTVSLVGSATVNLIAQDSGASTWAVAVVADNTNKCIQVQVTGVAATTIDWVAHCYVVEAA